MKESKPVVNRMQSTREINEQLARTAELLEQRVISLRETTARLQANRERLADHLAENFKQIKEANAKSNQP
jgi:chaperonin cofactor prefoldin